MKSWNGHDSLEIWDLNSVAQCSLKATSQGMSRRPGPSIPMGGSLPSAGLMASIVVVDLVDGRELRRWTEGFGQRHRNGVQS